jgi:hypothetical protein
LDKALACFSQLLTADSHIRRMPLDVQSSKSGCEI